MPILAYKWRKNATVEAMDLSHFLPLTTTFFNGIARLSRLYGCGNGSEALTRLISLSATALAYPQHLALTIAPSVHVWTQTEQAEVPAVQ